MLQGNAIPHEALGSTRVGEAAEAPVPHPLAPTATVLQSSFFGRSYPEAAPFIPASLAEVEMDVDVHSAPGAATSTAAQPAVGMEVDEEGQSIQKVASEKASSHAHPLPSVHIPERSLQIGDFVEIHGLLGSVELNGRRGRIVSFVWTTSRFEVLLEGVKDTIGVKATNPHRFVVARRPFSFSRWGSGLRH